MLLVRVPPEQLFFSFSMEKEMFRFVVLPCFDLGLTVPLLKLILYPHKCKYQNVIYNYIFAGCVINEEQFKMHCPKHKVTGQVQL